VGLISAWPKNTQIADIKWHFFNFTGWRFVRYSVQMAKISKKWDFWWVSPKSSFLENRWIPL